MSRLLKKQLFSMADSLDKANKILEKNLLKKKIDQQALTGLLSDCQESAITMGNLIEKLYGEGTRSVKELEEYCEDLYQMTLSMLNPLARRELLGQLGKHIKRLRRNLAEEVSDRLEVVFFPYKISMWDSLESIWKAADADPDCDAYVVPIPYYDRDSEGRFTEMHYEGGQYPESVPVVPYEAYDLESRLPDVIFIHNPYDNYNYVTSVHPRYYSKNLKGLTNSLVYVPYFSTSGGMSEGQSKCIAYYYADYIIMQSEKMRRYYDPELPAEKLLPLGSPKFDRIVHICQNPPKPPENWKKKMAGRKVYFYNTSLGGMLGNTPGFLKKMEYVFKCFEGREDACLLWRPHPLLESTFESVRAKYKPVYDKLKEYFIRKNLGIYDDTPEIADTIALCDAYVGDSGTSVTSLFGIVGKPMFILNNDIHSEPKEDDWRGQVITGFSLTEEGAWMITQGNKLYYSPTEPDNEESENENRMKFRFYCDLSDYAGGSYYSGVRYINGTYYVCPANAQDIVVLKDGQIDKRIFLENCIDQGGAFYTSAMCCERYLFLIPNNYPAIVRYDTFNGEIRYLSDHLDVFGSVKRGEKQVGGVAAWKEYLYLASSVDNQVLRIHAETLTQQIITVGSEDSCGCVGFGFDGKALWLLPYEGKMVKKWNPETGEVKEYTEWPEGFTCFHPVREYECEGFPFSSVVFHKNYAYFSPNWGNMYVRLDLDSGEAIQWIPPVCMPDDAINGYYGKWTRSYFMLKIKDFSNPMDIEGAECWLFSLYDKRLYKLDFETNGYEEIKLEFDVDELRDHEPGFKESSQWLIYACCESSFNSLPDFLDGNITGNAFDKDRQIRGFSQIAANPDGSSGEKIYQFMKSKA